MNISYLCTLAVHYYRRPEGYVCAFGSAEPLIYYDNWESTWIVPGTITELE